MDRYVGMGRYVGVIGMGSMQGGRWVSNVAKRPATMLNLWIATQPITEHMQ